MEGVARRQDAAAAGAAARELDRGLDRLRAAVGEYDMGEARRRHREQARGQFALGIRDRCNDEVRQLFSPGGLQRPPDRFRMVAERNRAKLCDEIGVARSVRVDEMASLATHERLVEAQTLIEEALVGRDVPYVGGAAPARSNLAATRARSPRRRERTCGPRSARGAPRRSRAGAGAASSAIAGDGARLRLRRCSASNARFCAVVSSSSPPPDIRRVPPARARSSDARSPRR